MYAFSRDILRHKITEERKLELIRNAISCGYQKAEEYLALAGLMAGDLSAPAQLADFLKLRIGEGEGGQTGGRILFASFTPPKQIEIMREPLEAVVNSKDFKQILSMDMITALLLGHEIFHYIEEQEPAIYTRTTKQPAQGLLGFRFLAPINAVSEIAAMYFSQRMAEYSYSSFALDILLYYNYNSTKAIQMYEEVSGY